MTHEKINHTLADLRNGDMFTVHRVGIGSEVGKRLADMGFTEGAEGTVVRCALLGDPIQLKILGYDVSIRVSEASGIEVIRHETVTSSLIKGGSHGK